MYSRIVVFFLLFALWSVVSAHYLAWDWWLGGIACLLVTYISAKMGLISGSHLPLRGYLKMPIYIVWLLGQITVANINVAKRILSPSLPIAPRFITVSNKRRNSLTEVLYPNSITLTPGTISADVAGDEIKVHALSEDSARSVQSGTIEKKITWLEQ